MEFNQVLDWRAGPGVCRCCLSEGCYKDISTEYFWMGEKEIYAEMLLECYSLTISYQEGRPNSNSRLICEVCITRLRDAANFKKQVINSERNFAKHLIEVPVEREVEVTYTPTESLPIQQVKDESRVSDDGDFDDSQFDANFDCDDDADDQPLKNFATNVLKREDTVPDVTVEKVKTKDGKSPSKRKAAAKKGGVSPAKKAKAMKQEKEAKPSSSKPPKTERKKGRARQSKENGEQSMIKVEDEDIPLVNFDITQLEEICKRPKYQRSARALAREAIKNNATIILETSSVCPFRWWRNRFVCAYCDTKFTECAPLREHSQRCGAVCTPLDIYRKFKELAPINVDLTDAACRLCDAPVRDIERFKTHLVGHGRALDAAHPDGVLPFSLDKESWRCVRCDAEFNNFLKLYEHMNTHYQHYICDICGKGFMSAPRLRKHTESHESGTFPCGSCNRIFTMRAAREHHRVRAHAKGPRYECPHCDQRFERYYDRMRHLSQAHCERAVEYRCSHCELSFETSGKRSLHVRTAHFPPQRTHACTECEWNFRTPYELKRHMVRHSGERNFHCLVCGKSYPRGKTLREHMRAHDDDRRYACALCGQAFLQKCGLRQHARTHHPELAAHLMESKLPPTRP